MQTRGLCCHSKDTATPPNPPSKSQAYNTDKRLLHPKGCGILENALVTKVSNAPDNHTHRTAGHWAAMMT